MLYSKEGQRGVFSGKANSPSLRALNTSGLFLSSSVKERERRAEETSALLGCSPHSSVSGGLCTQIQMITEFITYRNNRNTRAQKERQERKTKKKNVKTVKKLNGLCVWCQDEENFKALCQANIDCNALSETQKHQMGSKGFFYCSGH